jgi:hypothetical protein
MLAFAHAVSEYNRMNSAQALALLRRQAGPSFSCTNSPVTIEAGNKTSGLSLFQISVPESRTAQYGAGDFAKAESATRS